jgi:LysW-gamma-L-lysine carboxypeptidase
VVGGAAGGAGMNEAVRLLREMVAIRSLSGAEGALADYLVGQMAARGMESFVDGAGNAVGIRANPDGGGAINREIVLLGHMDTVPGEIPVRIADGVLYGRGAVDAKGPLAAFIVAAGDAELPPGTRLIVIGAVEEESATSKGARFAAAQYQPDFCIIGEPSGWDGVTLGYKGRLLLDFHAAQEMGHTAGPEQAVAETAVAWWNQIAAFAAEFNAAESRLFYQLLPTLRDIHTASDGLTNSVTARVGVRLPPEFDAEQFSVLAQKWAGGATITAYGYEPAVQVGRGSLLARQFGRVLLEMGRRPRFKLKTGTADMNVVAPLWRCPIVAYGPGDSSFDHTPHEHLHLDEYEKAIAVLVQVLAQLTG